MNIEPATVDPDVVARARQRGNELWAEKLIAEEDVESVDGPIDLEEILASPHRRLLQFSWRK